MIAKAKGLLSKISNAGSFSKAAGLTGGAYLLTKAASYALPADFYSESGLDMGDTLSNVTANLMTLGGMPGISATSALDRTVSSISQLAQTPGVGAAVVAPTATGAAIGGMLGSIAAMAMTAGRKNISSKSKMIQIGATSLLGALVGGRSAFKLSNNITEMAANIHRGLWQLEPQMNDNRAFGSGSGFRSWAKLPGRSMPVGHLGATGDLVLAMHRTRHRSMF
jgi:hypothetical protein